MPLLVDRDEYEPQVVPIHHVEDGVNESEAVLRVHLREVLLAVRDQGHVELPVIWAGRRDHLSYGLVQFRLNGFPLLLWDDEAAEHIPRLGVVRRA